MESSADGRFKSYQDLEVWKKGLALTKEIYRVRSCFPAEEKFGLVSQMRRCAVSIPSNLAEGHARFGSGEFQRFISIAMGSVAELETQIILSESLGYLKKDGTLGPLLDQLDMIGKMPRGLARSLERRKKLRS